MNIKVTKITEVLRKRISILYRNKLKYDTIIGRRFSRCQFRKINNEGNSNCKRTNLCEFGEPTTTSL